MKNTEVIRLFLNIKQNQQLHFLASYCGKKRSEITRSLVDRLTKNIQPNLIRVGELTDLEEMLTPITGVSVTKTYSLNVRVSPEQKTDLEKEKCLTGTTISGLLIKELESIYSEVMEIFVEETEH